MADTYKMCGYCVMDTAAEDIEFDIEGRCNYCRAYEERAKREVHSDAEGRKRLDCLVAKIKKERKGKDYDCLIGLSGGTDSSMVAYIVKRELGLKPLAVHFDNGWDSELAVNNIERIVKGLNIDLYSYVVNWEEFRDLLLAFLRSSISNSEIPTDHGIVATMYRTAKKYDLKYIFSGSNIVGEAIMPAAWMYDATDWRLIKGIHREFGKHRLTTYPKMTLHDWVYYTFIKRIRFIPLLNYFDYNVQNARSLLNKEIGWRDYGDKHCESVYTRFFQNYILPIKYNMDKRKAHYSTLICSGQMTRDEALKKLNVNPYSEPRIVEDKEYVIKKLGIDVQEFDRIMSSPVRTYRDYPNNYFWFNKLKWFVRYAKKLATDINEG